MIRYSRAGLRILRRFALVTAVLCCACTAQQAIRTTSFITPSDDPKQMAQMLSDGLDQWDKIVGQRTWVPIRIVSVGERVAFSRETAGECLRVGSYREIEIDLDAIYASDVGRPRDVFRHVLWHEQMHVELTCTDADHSSDPTSLMFPTVTRANLLALPDRRLLE